jgi:DNA polymerase-3 subunit delta
MLYLAVGKNDFLREEFVQQLKALMHKLPLGEHNIDELGPGTSVAEVIAASSVTPFLSEKRMVIARGVLAGSKGRASRARARTRGAGASAPPSGPAAELAAWAPNLPETTHLVIVEDDPRTVEPLESIQPAPVRRDFAVLRDDALPGWISQRATKSYKTRINPRAASELAQLAGSDLRTLDAEIAKLATYVDPGQEIGVDDVRTLVSAVGPNIFAFQDAVAEQRPAAALSAARAMMDRGTDPMELFAQIVALVRRLLVVKELARTHRLSQDAVSFGLSSSPYAQQKLQRQAANLSSADLDRAYARMHDADMGIKTGRLEPAVAVELAITALVGLSPEEPSRR